MTDQALIDRLAALPTLATVPRQQLEWLVSHGTIRRFTTGEKVFAKGEAIQTFHVVLAGSMSIRLKRAGVSRRVRQWKTGDLTGYLPYSRMTEAPGDVFADEAGEMLAVRRELHTELVRECPDFTALCVHEMLDRARAFKSHDLQSEKMNSLGRLSAGIAHELNNPSAAVVRSAKELTRCREELEQVSRALGAAALSPPELEAVRALEAAIGGWAPHAEKPLDRADREDAVSQWLEDRSLDVSLAERLADAGLTPQHLDSAAAALHESRLTTVFRYVATSYAVRRLTGEIEVAASRIHSLVVAMKNYTHRDRTQEPEPMSLNEDLADTLTILRSEARRKGVTLSMEVDDGLPRILGVRGELNQVWLNLVDNAIDASPPSGAVKVEARAQGDAVVVSVIDNGAGIAPENVERLFEPFFTTKPVGEGTGLGLDIALGVVHRHGGSIEVDSAPGRTEFRVSLPIAGATPRTPPS